MKKKAKNKNLIYVPRGTTEFARLACNPKIGCVHYCKYCFGPASFRVSREDWTTPRVKADFLLNLLASIKDREKQNLPRHQILLEYGGDCYGDPNDTLTGRTIRILHDSGYGTCVLTKAPQNAIKDIKLFDPRIDCLGVSIATFDEKEISDWEPSAPHPSTRLAALKVFHDAGIYTWISMEPIISPATSLDVVRLTHACVAITKAV
jgi:DNA repair photolyase